jgi:hypothetical protein
MRDTLPQSNHPLLVQELYEKPSLPPSIPYPKDIILLLLNILNKN